MNDELEEVEEEGEEEDQDVDDDQEAELAARQAGQQVLDPDRSVDAWNDRLNTVEPIRMKRTKLEIFIVVSIAWRISAQVDAPARQRQHEGAGRAHRAAFGRRRDAEEDRAEDEEDQRERRDQDEGDALGHSRQQAELEGRG